MLGWNRCFSARALCPLKLKPEPAPFSISMAADNHLIQLAEPGLQGPDRSHWPTYDQIMATIKDIGLSSLHSVAYIREYEIIIFCSSGEVDLILAAGNAVTGAFEEAPVHSLIIPAGNHKSGHGHLVPPPPQRDLLRRQAASPFLSISSFIFTPLSFPFSPVLPIFLFLVPAFCCPSARGPVLTSLSL